jgi:hypothetical protein
MLVEVQNVSRRHHVVKWFVKIDKKVRASRVLMQRLVAYFGIAKTVLAHHATCPPQQE